RDGDRIWVLDEGSTNGTTVNGVAVPPMGTPLRDGDQISIGNHTTIVVSFSSAPAVTPMVEMDWQDPAYFQNPVAPVAAASSGLPLSLKLSLVFAAVVILVAGVALVARSFSGGESAHKTSRQDDPWPPISSETPVPSPSPNVEASPAVTEV